MASKAWFSSLESDFQGWVGNESFENQVQQMQEHKTRYSEERERPLGAEAERQCWLLETRVSRLIHSCWLNRILKLELRTLK
ncbi:hypothetical protein CMV_026379 [Castanea mollissima]|uniref:Uncharacterized protein n=1 Tax=Castanea mollissima TaxID=60419 RepID=A0A8J4QK75_9ROSI|nr:hypothetical protein CMV_026379 [Castanea mollissima]